MNAIPDHAIFENSTSSTANQRGWTIRRDAHFFNTLCSSAARRVNFLTPAEREGYETFFVKECEERPVAALQEAFRALKARYDLSRYDAKLTQSEFKVLQAIERKTFKFGKIFEKIPYRFFTRGQREDDGTLSLDNYGLPILPPTGIADKGNIARAVRGLSEKGLITHVEDDPHSKYGIAVVLAPLPVETVRDTFITNLTAEHINRPYELAEELHRRMTVRLCQKIESMAETLAGANNSRETL